MHVIVSVPQLDRREDPRETDHASQTHPSLEPNYVNGNRLETFPRKIPKLIVPILTPTLRTSS